MIMFPNSKYILTLIKINLNLPVNYLLGIGSISSSSSLDFSLSLDEYLIVLCNTFFTYWRVS